MKLTVGVCHISFQNIYMMTISVCLTVNDFRNAFLVMKNFYRSVSRDAVACFTAHIHNTHDSPDSAVQV